MPVNLKIYQILSVWHPPDLFSHIIFKKYHFSYTIIAYLMQSIEQKIYQIIIVPHVSQLFQTLLQKISFLILNNTIFYS